MLEAVLLVLLGAMSAGEALHLIHLPATSNVAENSSPGTSVHKFSVKLSASLSPVMPGLPLIINTSPLTEAFSVISLSGTEFEVVTTGKEQLDFETGPNMFDLQIYVKDDVGVTDLQILTVQVTDVNEPPQFPGNLAKGKIHRECHAAQMVASGRTLEMEQTRKVNEKAAVSLGKAGA